MLKVPSTTQTNPINTRLLLNPEIVVDVEAIPVARGVQLAPRCYLWLKAPLSKVFTGQIVGVREVDDRIWLVTFL